MAVIIPHKISNLKDNSDKLNTNITALSPENIGYYDKSVLESPILYKIAEKVKPFYNTTGVYEGEYFYFIFETFFNNLKESAIPWVNFLVVFSPLINEDYNTEKSALQEQIRIKPLWFYRTSGIKLELKIESYLTFTPLGISTNSGTIDIYMIFQNRGHFYESIFSKK